LGYVRSQARRRIPCISAFDDILHLNPETLQALRIAAIEEGISMNDALTLAVEDFAERKP